MGLKRQPQGKPNGIVFHAIEFESAYAGHCNVFNAFAGWKKDNNEKKEAKLQTPFSFWGFKFHVSSFRACGRFKFHVKSRKNLFTFPVQKSVLIPNLQTQKLT